MSNDDWVKSHREMDITTRLRYWAQNEDMIDQYYTQRGKDLLEAENEIIKLRTKYDAMSQVYQENVNQLHDALDRVEYLENALRQLDDMISKLDAGELELYEVGDFIDDTLENK